MCFRKYLTLNNNFMKKNQVIESRRQGGVHLYLTENAGIFAGHSGMELAVADLGLTQDAVARVIAKQVRGSKPTTAVKTDREIRMIRGVRKLCSGLVTVGEYGDLPDLVQLAAVTKTYVERLTAEKLVEFAGAITEEAEKYPAQLAAAGVPTTDVDLFRTQTAQFKVWARSPKNVIKKRKAATESVPALLEKGRSIIRTRLDGFMLDYEFTHPEFYAGYLTSKQADHLPVHHEDKTGDSTGVDSTTGVDPGTGK